MIKYCFILPYATYLPKQQVDTIYVGIDKGSLDALKQGYKLDYALGDFDSISSTSFEFVKNNVKKIIKLPVEKDDTDTEYALKYFNDADLVTIYGGITGKRVEHLYANINLCLKYKNVIFMDKYSTIRSIPNVMEIKNSDYYFYSFFADENSVISLKGFKYELSNYSFKYADNLCISNEIAASSAIITFSGNGIMIMTKDDSEELREK